MNWLSSCGALLVTRETCTLFKMQNQCHRSEWSNMQVKQQDTGCSLCYLGTGIIFKYYREQPHKQKVPYLKYFIGTFYLNMLHCGKTGMALNEQKSWKKRKKESKTSNHYQKSYHVLNVDFKLGWKYIAVGSASVMQLCSLVCRFRWPWTSTPLSEDDGKSGYGTNGNEIICSTHL